MAIILTRFIFFLPVICIADAMAFAEIEFYHRFSKTDRTKGWSYIVGYVGILFQLIAMILSCRSLCLKPSYNADF